MGRKIKQLTLQNNRNSIGVSDWSTGMYFIKTLGERATKKKM